MAKPQPEIYVPGRVYSINNPPLCPCCMKPLKPCNGECGLHGPLTPTFHGPEAPRAIPQRPTGEAVKAAYRAKRRARTRAKAAARRGR